MSTNAISRRVNLSTSGLRGESAADVARRVLDLPDGTTDQEALYAMIGDEAAAARDTAVGARDAVLALEAILEGAAAQALAAMTTALAAADAVGVAAIFDTKALATAGLSGVADNAMIEVLADESQYGHRTRYRKVAGALVLKKDMDAALTALAPILGGGVLAATAEDVRSSAIANRRVVVNGDFDIGETDDTMGYFDTVLIGDGRVEGLYRRRVVPFVAPPAQPYFADVTPAMLPALNAASAPRALLIGDSVSSHAANSWGASNMLTTVLERELREQGRAVGKSVTMDNRSIGGQTYSTLNALPNVTTWPEWYTDHAAEWLDYGEALAPDVVFLSFGMNFDAKPYTALDAVLTKIAGWAGSTDVVLCTNLVPSPSAASIGWNTIADQEARDVVAGLVRTYAKTNGLPLLDFHRMACMARDGFDPTRSVMRRIGVPVTPIGNVYAPNIFCWDFRLDIQFDTDLMVIDTTSLITVKVGAGSDDVLFIAKVTGGYTLTLYTGNGGGASDAAVQIHQETVALDADGSGVVRLLIERTNGYLIIRDLTDVVNYGEFTNPVFETALIVRGGRYVPIAQTFNATGAIQSATFDIGEPVLNQPSLTNSQLWGDGVNAIGTYGGSGYNHPSDFVAPLIYEPVLKQARFFG
jgi:hypothetical protein